MSSCKLLTRITTIFAGLLLIAGCDVSDSNSGGPKEVAVKMKIHNASQPKIKSATYPSTLSVDTLIEIKLLVEELELESAVDDDTLDFEAEDIVVNLPMDGSEFVLTSKTVPEGVYDEFELEVENDDDGSDVSDSDFQDDDGEYSVVVKGTYNGEAFTYRSEQDFEIEMDLNPPLEVTENSSSFSININIDPSTWFVDAQSGEPLDPTDPNNRSKIDDNIGNSFDAESEEDDDDDNGDDDDDDDDN